MWYMNEERQVLVNAFREFAVNEIRPFVDKMEREDAFPADALRKLGELGMLGLGMDESVGGAGADYINFGLMMEEFAKESHCFALLAYLVSQLTIGAFYKLCTPEQIEKFIKPALTGEKLCGVVVTEPSGVSNYPEHETRGVLDGDDIVINGTKVLITGADEMDLFFMVCKTGEVNMETYEGITFFIFPADTEGYSVGHIENKLGWNGSHTGQVYYDNCRVPQANIIGEFNKGMLPFALSLGPEFAAYGPMNLGAMQRCYDMTVEYLKNRMRGGVSLWDTHEVIRNEMARIWIKINNYRHATYGILQNRNDGKDITAEAIAIKVEGEELLREIASQCIEFHGGMGTVYETGVERFYRDAKMGGLGCGSNKTMVNTLSSML